VTALKKLALFSIIALLTVLLLGCGDPAADQEEIEEEEIQEEIEEINEDTKEEENYQEDNDNESGANNGSGSSGTSGSGFSHTIEMDINGEVKEGEGEGWWKDQEGGSDDEWWNN